MRPETRKLMMLEMLFTVLIVVSNVVNEKVLQFGSILLPGSAFIYIITFFISNMISEKYGKDEAAECVKQGIACNIVATILYIIVRFLPAQDPEMQKAFVIVLGTNWVFVVADITGCIISQFSQIHIFDRLRRKVTGKAGNFISMVLSQFIDTFVFLGIAFGLGSMWILTSEGRAMLLNMFISQYIIKIVIALILTQAFSFYFSKELKGDNNERNLR